MAIRCNAVRDAKSVLWLLDSREGEGQRECERQPRFRYFRPLLRTDSGLPDCRGVAPGLVQAEQETAHEKEEEEEEERGGKGERQREREGGCNDVRRQPRQSWESE